MNQNQELFLNLLKTEKICLMLAPSYIVDFKYPEIVKQLRGLGADIVTEITYGADITNRYYEDYISNNREQKYFISSPCPTIVNIIKNQYPELVKYLVPVFSPVMCQAHVMRQEYKEYKIIFIAPCIAKRELESKEYPGNIDLVITFRELKEILENRQNDDYSNLKDSFDSCIKNNTKIYPVSGGLTLSSNIYNLIPKEEVKISDGFLDVKEVLDKIQNETTEFRFFDLLNCEGGCINGPEVVNKKDFLDEKNEKIMKYKDKNIESEINGCNISKISFYNKIK